MDITEDILKLAALGWDGKEPELDFLHRAFGITIDIIPKNKAIEEIKISYIKDGLSSINLRKSRGNNTKGDFIHYCLRLFRTKNGEVVGPNSELFMSEDQEWT